MDKLTLKIATPVPRASGANRTGSRCARAHQTGGGAPAQAGRDAAAAELIADREASRTQLGLSDTDDLAEAMQRNQTELIRLQAAEQARQVAAYIDQECGQIKYADVLKVPFIEAVKAAGAKTVDEAKAVIIAKRAEYDKLQAGLVLAARGRGVGILGPVLERDRGVPEFARVAFELSESLVRGGHLQPRNLAQPTNVNERFAAQYLGKFDEVYQQRLAAEARAFHEAEQASELSLPYSVMRAVIAEALPELVALSVFDVQMVNPAPTTNISFETYAGKVGRDRECRG